jgi:hypothetical protein
MDDKMLRISPSDLLMLKNLPPERVVAAESAEGSGQTSRPLQCTPTSQTTASPISPDSPPNMATVCRCRDGYGWYTLPVPRHDPDFGRLFRCVCKAQEDSEAFTASLRQDRGRFATADFDGFDEQRELPGEEIWKNGVFDSIANTWGNVIASVPE